MYLINSFYFQNKLKSFDNFSCIHNIIQTTKYAIVNFDSMFSAAADVMFIQRKSTFYSVWQTEIRMLGRCVKRLSRSVWANKTLTVPMCGMKTCGEETPQAPCVSKACGPNRWTSPGLSQACGQNADRHRLPKHVSKACLSNDTSGHVLSLSEFAPSPPNLWTLWPGMKPLNASN